MMKRITTFAMIVVALCLAGCGGVDGFEFNGLYWQVGPDRDMNWDEAKAWADSLGGDWRLPTLAELRGLWDSGISSNDWGPFETGGDWVWSGEVRDSLSAWNFVFHYGLDDWHYRSYSSFRRAFAVRSP